MIGAYLPAKCCLACSAIEHEDTGFWIHTCYSWIAWTVAWLHYGLLYEKRGRPRLSCVKRVDQLEHPFHFLADID
jgi:hypothetical protein